MCVRHIEITTLEMVDVCTYMWQSAIGAQSSLIIAGGSLLPVGQRACPAFIFLTLDLLRNTNTKIKKSKASRLSRAIN